MPSSLSKFPTSSVKGRTVGIRHFPRVRKHARLIRRGSTPRFVTQIPILMDQVNATEIVAGQWK